MKSSKPPLVICVVCGRRQNLVEHEGKPYCRWHDPLDREGAQHDREVRLAKAGEAVQRLEGALRAIGGA